jgi:hypothetical protein
MSDIQRHLQKLDNGDWALVMQNDYDRAMTFCRLNEFYSGSKEFKGRYFTIFEFMRSHSLENENVFTYTGTSKEFSVPFPIVKLWNETIINHDDIQNLSPHERILFDVWDEIEVYVGKNKNFNLLGLKTL